MTQLGLSAFPVSFAGSYDSLMPKHSVPSEAVRGFVVPEELLKAFHKGEGVLWLGAGTSLGSGLPTWRSLIEAMVGYLNRQGAMSETALTHADSYLDIAELFRATVGPNEFYSFLRSQIAGKSPDTIWSTENDTLSAVAEMANRFWPKPGLVMVSTNYDNLLEDLVNARHAKRVRTIISDTDLATASFGKELCLLKPHGDIAQPNSIVITFSDYCTFAQQKSAFVNTLSELLASRTVLFVGYGLGDFTFNALLGSVVSRYRAYKRNSFAIATHTSEAKKAALAAIGVRVLDIDNYDRLPHFLQALASNRSTVENASDKGQIPSYIIQALSSKSLLIIDDSTFSLRLRTMGVRECSTLRVTAHSDAAKAIQIIRRKRFDFILTDLAMPVRTGFDVIKAARGSTPNKDSIIAVSSGFDDEEVMDRAIQAGADAFFPLDLGFSDILAEFYRLNRIKQRTEVAP